ncbi:ATP-binding protein [Mesorhizobium sp. NPDC059025]|uniref:ATP-binding protein n=1 Tax=unclassified Mesorhizobium TaxID=325217 RepID=UPI0036C6C405
MKSASGLNRHLMIWMAAITGIALAAMIVGMFLFYALIEHIDPAFWWNDWNSYWPQPLEWMAFVSLWMLGIGGAIVAAAYFTRRLIRPLEAVGSAAQRIASGDLTARAAPQGAMFDETRQLVDDFNAMADQLRRAEMAMRDWNLAIAHELRTPLAILRGRLQGIVDGVFTAETVSFRGLVAQVDSLTRIVEDLNIFTLAQSGRLELQLETIDLAEEVITVVSVVAPELKKAGIDVLFDLGSGAQVVADSARIRQAILAILDNARKYAAPGTLRIEAHATHERGILRFCDDGPGLPCGREHLVFEPFWRADEWRLHSNGGSGLGLAVVQAIARAHGGATLARAATPRGAIFEICLPYTEATGV